MERLHDVQVQLEQEYINLEKELPTLDTSNEQSLTHLLNHLTRLQIRTHLKKGRDTKEFSTIKALIADNLLLLDGFDIKKNMNKHRPETSAVN
jgi:hypothetical protein